MPTQTDYERGDKFIRVIRVLDMLARTRTGRTTEELAAELGVDRRSVQRYLGQMRSSGLDIVETEGRYRLGPGSLLPPLQFTKPEAVAVLVALRLLQQMRPERDDALLGAVGRLAQAMQVPAVTQYLGTMERRLETGAEPGTRTQVEATVVSCFVDRIPCEVTYRNADGAQTRRTLRPYFLEPRPESRTVYVYAHDSRAQGLRCFRMDRIDAARPVLIEGRYEVPETFDIAELTRSSWGVWQAAGDGDLEEVVLRFRPRIRERVRQSVWHQDAVLTDLPDGGVEMRLHVASEIEMRPWVLGWGALVEVLAPPSLREHVAESMRAGAHLYDGGVSPA